MYNFKKIVSIAIAIILTASFIFLTASAEEDFQMKTLDKAYITFIFDDGRMPFTEDAAMLFKQYNMPMSCAIIANRVTRDSKMHKLLLEIQSNGGEILAHGYSHNAITSQEKANGSYIYLEDDIDFELGQGWRHLNALGLNVNGMIQVGCGGAENTADFELVEKVARKYYKYSNQSGLSPQYVKERYFMSWKGSNKDVIALIDNAIANKEWLILSAHDFNEIPSDADDKNDSRDQLNPLRKILQHLHSKKDSVEVVTWNYMYEKFGEYTGAQTPTKEALTSLEEYKKTLNKPVSSTPDISTSTPVYSQENTSSSKNENSSSQSSSSQTAVTSEITNQETILNTESQTDSIKQENPKKKNNKTAIIAGIAVAVALASVIAAVIIILKIK